MSVPVICSRQACGPAWMSACRNRAGALHSPSSHALSGHAPETQPLCYPFLCSRCPRQSPPRLGWTLPRNTAPPPPTRNLRQTYLCQVSSFLGGSGLWRVQAGCAAVSFEGGTGSFLFNSRVHGQCCLTKSPACWGGDVLLLSNSTRCRLRASSGTSWLYLHIVFGPCCAPHKSLGYVVCRLRPL